MRLFSYWRSSCSYRVRIGLYLKGIPFKCQPVNLIKPLDGHSDMPLAPRRRGEQFRESFRAISPLSQVPCLRHKGGILTQSLPILLYLEDLQPDPPLLPKEPFRRAEILSACEMINSAIQPLQNLSVLNHVENGLNGNKARWARFWMEPGLAALESFLEPRAGEFCFGDSLTMADLFLIPQIYNARRFRADLSQAPRLCRIEARCLQLPAFQKALPENQPDAPQAKKT